MSGSNFKIISSTITATFLCFLYSEVSFAQTNTEGHWRFEQSMGEIVDSYPRKWTVDRTNGRQNNGFVGSWDGAWSENENPLSRNGIRVKFTGETQDHIIMIDDEVHQDFNADIYTFVWKVKLKIDSRDLEPGNKLARNATWNVMQKGRFNKGGMWKMQIMPFAPKSDRFFNEAQQEEIANSDWELQARAGDPVIMCQVQDENNTTFEVMSRVRLVPGTIYYPRCVINRSDNKLKAPIRFNKSKKDIKPETNFVAVNKTPLTRIVDGKEVHLGTVNPGMFGTFTCVAGRPDGFEGHDLLNMVSIGHKPVCPGFSSKRQEIIDNPNSSQEEIDAAKADLEDLFQDAFKGKIYRVKIEKPTTF